MMTTSTPPSPDDICAVCSSPRDQHGDMNHEFSINGELVTVKPGPPPTNNPPKKREDKEQLVPVSPELPTPENFVALLDILISKDIINAQEVIYILGGGGDLPGRPTPK